MTEEMREVDMIKRANKIGVWERGVSKGLKQYDPETYEHDKEVAQKIAEMQSELRRNGGNVTDQNMDIMMEDALDEMAAEEMDRAEMDFANLGEDYDDGDPFGDERNDDDYE
jgi:hypothetical protein